MASSVVASVGKQVGSLLVEEGKYLREVKKKAKRLQRELQWMGYFLQDADNKEHQDRAVKQWIADIRGIAYEAEDIIERYVHGFSHHREGGIQNIIKRFSCLICDAWDLHNVGLYIDELRTDIAELTTRLGTYGVQSVKQPENPSAYSTMAREKRRTYLRVEDRHVIELTDEMEKVVDALVNKECLVVGVCGMGGLGKTTFAKKIVWDTRVLEHFNSCAWVYVSQKVDRRGAFEEILDGLGYDPANEDLPPADKLKKIKDLSDQKLLEEICKILEKKSCLVVLDDIWTINDWKLLEPAFGSTLRESSSKILLTTRSEELPKQADPKAYSLNLRFLEKEEAWTLFSKKLSFIKGQNEDVVVDGKMEKLGRQMIDHCNGLPLVVVALAGILATKRTIKEWANVRQMTGIMNENVSSVLELSFHELPFYLKPCFMYLGHFPEGYEIPVETLYSLWEAQGIVAATVNDVSPNQEASGHEIAENYLNELVQRSMVLVDKYWENGRIRSCRLHDVMRYICLKKCKEVSFLTTIGDLDNPTTHFARSSYGKKRMRHCAIQVGDGSRASAFFLQHKKETYCLRSLLMFANGKSSDFRISSAQLKNLSILRVLGLKGLRIGSRAAKTIGKLIHLKFLSFEGSDLKEVPSCIFHLKFLETLDLRVSNWSVILPSKLSKMERLRHLYLPRLFEVTAKGDKKLIISERQLAQMETLINFNPFLCQMDMHKLLNLRFFSLHDNIPTMKNGEWKSFLESPVMTSGHLMNPMTLFVPSCIFDEEPTSLTSSKFQAYIPELTIQGHLRVNSNLHGVLPNSLIKLDLWGCDVGNEGVSQVQKLPHLQELTLRGKWSEKKMSFSDGGFPQLVKLTISRLSGLEKWEVGEGALLNLRYLFIVSCNKLEMVPQNLPSTLKIGARTGIKGIEKYDNCLYR